MAKSRNESGRPYTWTVWGCRGGVSVTGTRFVRHGGTTTCLELDLPDARILIDAGSSLPELGRTRGHDGKPTLLLFTHVHWDHIIGLPHWGSIYRGGWSLDVRGVPRSGQSVWDAVLGLNRPPIFPVELERAMQVEVTSSDLDDAGEEEWRGVGIRWMPVEHPGGCTAFSLQVGGRTFVFTGDVEVARMDARRLVEFARGADVLVMDAQYTEAEYRSHVGWGHSTNLQAAEIARSSGVGELVLTHHDPSHDDDMIDAMVADARAVFPNTSAATAGGVLARGQV